MQANCVAECMVQQLSAFCYSIWSSEGLYVRGIIPCGILLFECCVVKRACILISKHVLCMCVTRCECMMYHVMKLYRRLAASEVNILIGNNMHVLY